jgi:hypothetical protein
MNESEFILILQWLNAKVFLWGRSISLDTALLGIGTNAQMERV